ncbi:MAG TPA: CPBP family intramembrane glutamic endopeptidase [Thermoanaerobaculia bacterium]|jgi:membrane protease YdiL (CAAX protease family)
MWRRIPIWIRAVVTGLIVAGVPTFVWALLAGINLRFTPRVPWSVPVMAMVLLAYWRYVGGDGPPRRLSAIRSERLRALPLSPRVWRLSLIAGGLGVAAVWATFAALRGVLHIIPPADNIARFPVWTIFAAIMMGSAVAGVAEEAGFRGYMQLPLERAYGPLVAVGTTSILFTLVHLSHGARILPFLPFYFVVAVLYGLLALLTGSIFPSMTLHFAGDVLMFSFQYLNLRFGAPGGAETGRILPLPALVAVALGAASVIAFRVLARNGRAIAPAKPEPAMSH